MYDMFLLYGVLQGLIHSVTASCETCMQGYIFSHMIIFEPSCISEITTLILRKEKGGHKRENLAIQQSQMNLRGSHRQLGNFTGRMNQNCYIMSVAVLIQMMMMFEFCMTPYLFYSSLTDQEDDNEVIIAINIIDLPSIYGGRRHTILVITRISGK